MDAMASSSASVRLPAFRHSRPPLHYLYASWDKAAAFPAFLISGLPHCIAEHSPLSASPAEDRGSASFQQRREIPPNPRSSGAGREEMKAAFLPFLLMTPTWTLIANPQHTSAVTALSDANRSRAEMDTQTSLLPVLRSSRTHTHTK